jgi:hypothetical protein
MLKFTAGALFCPGILLEWLKLAVELQKIRIANVCIAGERAYFERRNIRI